MLKLARKAGEAAYGPSVETERNGTYPISRPLYMYSLGAPTGDVKKYLEWVYSDVGQEIVAASGYVPLSVEECSVGRKALGESA